MSRSNRIGGRRAVPPPTLVIGGAGFIGSHTVEALLDRGGTVRVLDNFSAGKRGNLPAADQRLEILQGDILEYPDVIQAMRGMRHCVHLAAQVSVARSIEDPFASALCNIMGFINVLQAASAERIERLVYASSAAVYGDSTQLPLQEDTELRPVNPYGLEKLVNERYAEYYQRQTGLSLIGLRYFNVYGRRQDPNSPYSGVISRFIERIGADRAPTVFGDGRQTRDFIYVKDIARANLAALGSDHCGVCNVATGDRVDLLKLTRVLGRRLEVSVKPAFAPARPGDIRHSCGDAGRLRRQLGFEARTRLEEGLGEMLAGPVAVNNPAPSSSRRWRRRRSGLSPASLDSAHR